MISKISQYFIIQVSIFWFIWINISDLYQKYGRLSSSQRLEYVSSLFYRYGNCASD